MGQNTGDSCGANALLKPVGRHREDVVAVLLGHSDINVNAARCCAKTALMRAVKKGRVAVVRQLLDKHAIVQHHNRSGETALDIATRLGFHEIASLLVQAGAEEPSVRLGEDGLRSLSPKAQLHLLVAVKEGWLGDVIELLTKCPEAIEITDDDLGATPLLLSVMHQQADITRLLLLLGADPDGTSLIQETALMLATRDQCSGDIVRSLLDHSADVNAARADGWTALMPACQVGHVETTQLLLEGGADDVNAGSNDVMTAHGGHAARPRGDCCEACGQWSRKRDWSK